MQANLATPDYCISCTYFNQTKGHFGSCSIINNKPYDGTKKGTGCVCWRIKTDIQQLVEQPKPVEKHIASLRTVYNKSRRQALGSIGNIKITNIDGQFVSIVNELHSKNGYYGHRYNYIIIDRSITLFLTGMKYKEIAEYLRSINCRVPDKNSIKAWVINMIGKEAWGYWERCKCGGNLVKNGKKRRKCNSCLIHLYK